MSLSRLIMLLAGAALMATGCGHNRPIVGPDGVLVDTGPKTQQPTRPPVDPARFAAATEAAAEAMDAGLEAAMQRCVGWRTLPQDKTWQEILDPDREPKGSMSAGTVAGGVLLGGVELVPEGTHHQVIERHRTYKTRWGTQELVDLIQFGASYVAEREGGAPLRVGNMSKKKGGDIRWSNSHNSGRDADLAFYMLDAKSGGSIPAPALVSFEDGGVASNRSDVVFDLPRNWRLVEGLLSHPTIGVQWLFISIPLKRMLLDHARSIGADPELIRRAESVLHQPTDSSPHSDHFHLRITCPKDDRLDGCLDYGPQWDWVDWHRPELLARAVRLAEVFSLPEQTPKLRALEFLDRIKNPYAADVATVWGIWDVDDEVRETAMDVTAGQYTWSATSLVELQKLIRDPNVSPRHLARAYSVLRRSVDPLARDFALQRLVSADVGESEKIHAVRALGHFMEPALVESLIGQLAIQPAAVRVEIAEILRRITNRDDGVDWSRANESQVAKGLADWRGWWTLHKAEPRDKWLALGFAEHGVPKAETPQPEHVDALLGLLRSGPPHVVYNANRTVRSLTGRWAPLEQTDGGKLYDYWEKWWAKNKTRVLTEGAIGDS